MPKKEKKELGASKGNIAERGLAAHREKGDEKWVRHYKDPMFGFSYENEFYQPMPFFFTREGNNCHGLIGMYKGATAFLICGGPSFNKLDQKKLDLCWTMAVNNAPKTYRPDAWMCVDDPSRFLTSIWTDPKIMKIVPFDHTEKEIWDSYNNCPMGLRVGDCPNMYFFRRNNKFEAKRWLRESTLNWGNHKKFGGKRSVMLPALRTLFLMGFRTVYLLGVDFDMTEEEGYHFDEERNEGAVKGNASSYKRMEKEYFPKLRPLFEKVGFNVFNCNPDSNLTVFDHVPFDKAVEHATTILGDVANEPTRGMYKDPDKKKKEYKEKIAKKEKVAKKKKKNDKLKDK